MIAVRKDDWFQGFHMTFPNGWTVSVQFGKGNYCTSRGNPDGSEDAKIAAWDANGEWYTFPDSDGVAKGWVTAKGIAEFIAMISAKEK